MNILLIHPEGNLNYNANLLGIVELLGDAGHRISYVAPRRPELGQACRLQHVTSVLLDNPRIKGQFIFTGQPDATTTPANPDFTPWAGHDFVLAVDRGVIEGSWIARYFRIPHALLSYEIFFEHESSAEFKQSEIEACRDLAFAVSQDALRSAKLAAENRIPDRSILQIPVAGRGFRGSRPKPRTLHELFQLRGETRIVLYTGTLADWSGERFLLESTRHWPDPWVLVIHERYGAAPTTYDLIQKYGDPARVRVSKARFDDLPEMSDFVQSADLGVALYTPTYANEFVGRNIECIGLASGKIASYLQHGIPVATHELGELSELIRTYRAGQVFSPGSPFIPEMPSAQSFEACRRLFEEQLDLERVKDTLLDALGHSVAMARTT